MRALFVVGVLAACGSDQPSCPALDDTTQNAECTNGCTPTQLVTTGARTSNLVLAAGTLAWLDHDTGVDRVMTWHPTAGTGERAQVRRIAGHATHLRTNGSVLAWNEGPTIFVDGTAFTTSSAFFNETRFALDATHLFVPQDNSFDAIVLAGGAIRASWIAAPVDVVADTNPLLVTCGSAYRANLDGIVERITAYALCGARITKNTAYAFVNANIAACNVTGLVRIDLETGETLVLVIDELIGSIAADETHAYYAKPTGLFRVSVDGGAPARIVEGAIDSFTLDGTNIYAITGGVLVQIAK